MEIPAGVKQALIAMWSSLAVSAGSAVYCKINGLYSEGMFMWAIFCYSLLCIVPYKLSVRSNSTRYIYAIITAITVIMGLAGIGDVNPIDLYVSITLIPVEIFILYRLFQREATVWFTAKYA